MWKSVGDLLEFDAAGEQLLQVEENNRGNYEACCRDVFQLWLMGNGRQPCSWRELIKILKDCELEAIAKEVEAAIK